jgi:ribosomal protein S18 acetylase RimI-like enzyme
MQIRQYDPGDHEAVLDLHERALRDAGGYVEGVAEPDLKDIPGSYLDGGEFLVGERDGQIVAMCAFRPVAGYLTEFLDDLDDGTAELKRLRVDPHSQRQGFGAEIYRELESRARSREFSEFVLDTTPQQRPARSFFDAMGFSLAGETTVETDEKRFELLFYRKPIA